jgi:hypothetical protein
LVGLLAELLGPACWAAGEREERERLGWQPKLGKRVSSLFFYIYFQTKSFAVLNFL